MIAAIYMRLYIIRNGPISLSAYYDIHEIQSGRHAGPRPAPAVRIPQFPRQAGADKLHLNFLYSLGRVLVICKYLSWSPLVQFMEGLMFEFSLALF